MKTKRTSVDGYVMLKHDMSKAYDGVVREFFRRMKKMGFAHSGYKSS